jgi:hypothetical protein
MSELTTKSFVSGVYIFGFDGDGYVNTIIHAVLPLSCQSSRSGQDMETYSRRHGMPPL